MSLIFVTVVSSTVALQPFIALKCVVMI